MPEPALCRQWRLGWIGLPGESWRSKQAHRVIHQPVSVVSQCDAGAWWMNWLAEISADLRIAVGDKSRVRDDELYKSTATLLYFAYASSQKLLNKSAMHAVISLLQSNTFRWYILLFSSMLLHDVIMTSYWRHSVFTCLHCLHSLREIMGFNARGNSWTAASRKARLYCAQPVASKPHRSQSCELRDLGCHAIATSCLYQRHCHSVKELKGRLIDDWCMRSWTVDFWRSYWPVARKTSSMCPY